MARRYVALVLAASLLMVSSNVIAQECSIAAYADPAGTRSDLLESDLHFDGLSGYPMASIYVVMFVENTTNAAAYKVTFGGDWSDWFLQDRSQGSSGQGLFIDEDPATIGTNVALTECVLGFGGVPVLVEEYRFAVLELDAGVRSVDLSANTNQDPELPVYVTCSSTKTQCEVGPRLNVLPYLGIPAGKSSFGQIKSLYN